MRATLAHTSPVVIRGVANEERSMTETKEKRTSLAQRVIRYIFMGRSGFRNSLAIYRRFVVAATTTTTTEAICAPRRPPPPSGYRDGVKQREKGEKGPGWELGGAPTDQLEVGKIEETKGQMPRDG
ncbi:hypothetical protein ALC62_04798 [Cyphomyrmex costatus]|uniref:Uncharacterized protein n=1 Tax=Cyphomyrmex costatus TaxID=456900 RepID=A0A195CV43_9HYME|nr:hypothetical protein ALC62_04798 [Cyphomyrmex costatus]